MTLACETHLDSSAYRSILVTAITFVLTKVKLQI